MLKKLFLQNAIIPFGDQYNCNRQKIPWKGRNNQYNSPAAPFTIAGTNRNADSPAGPALCLHSQVYHHGTKLLTSLPASGYRLLLHFLYCMVSHKKLHEYLVHLKNVLPAPVLLHPHAIAIPIKKSARRVSTLKKFYRDKMPATEKEAAWKIYRLYYKKTKNTVPGGPCMLHAWLKLKRMTFIAVNYPTALI